MSSIIRSNRDRPVLLAVIVTDRPEALARMMDSLLPVAGDAGVHLLVLDNSEHRHEAVRDVVERAARGATGQRVLQRAQRACAPLHMARQELAAAAEAWCAGWAPDAIVWMLDDDLTFEMVHLDDGCLHISNVAAARIAQVRALAAEHPELALGVGGFTGDPPVRPEAILATQLSDLSAALLNAAPRTLQEPWPQESSPPRSGDYYYDHAEHQHAHLSQCFPWLPRSTAAASVEAQLETLLIEARGIRSGQTPFRPLLEPSSPQTVRFTETPNRGGNAIFFHRSALLQHTYPSFPVGDAWSRRSDMIGAAELARRHGALIADVPVTLRHNRAGQASVEPGIERWLPEFAGVLLARLSMSERPSPRDALECVRQIADERSRRIDAQLQSARSQAERALCALNQPEACWWTHPTLQVAAAALRCELEALRETLRALDLSDLQGALNTPALAQQVVDAYHVLAFTPQEEARCAG